SFSESGLFLIFDAFRNGPNSSSTGCRAYFLFPERGIPRFRKLSNGDIQVATASGQSVEVSAADGRLKSISGAKFAEDPVISSTNQGGVELLKTGSIWLDSGWQIGDVPYRSAARSSVFHDPEGGTCAVKNS